MYAGYYSYASNGGKCKCFLSGQYSYILQDPAGKHNGF